MREGRLGSPDREQIFAGYATPGGNGGRDAAQHVGDSGESKGTREASTDHASSADQGGEQRDKEGLQKRNAATQGTESGETRSAVDPALSDATQVALATHLLPVAAVHAGEAHEVQVGAIATTAPSDGTEKEGRDVSAATPDALGKNMATKEPPEARASNRAPSTPKSVPIDLSTLNENSKVESTPGVHLVGEGEPQDAPPPQKIGTARHEIEDAVPEDVAITVGENSDREAATVGPSHDPDEERAPHNTQGDVERGKYGIFRGESFASISGAGKLKEMEADTKEGRAQGASRGSVATAGDEQENHGRGTSDHAQVPQGSLGRIEALYLLLSLSWAINRKQCTGSCLKVILALFRRASERRAGCPATPSCVDPSVLTPNLSSWWPYRGVSPQLMSPSPRDTVHQDTQGTGIPVYRVP